MQTVLPLQRTPQNICKSKVRHTTAAKANASASRVGSKGLIKGLHAYKCPVCRGWHLTHKPRSGTR